MLIHPFKTCASPVAIKLFVIGLAKHPPKLPQGENIVTYIIVCVLLDYLILELASKALNKLL